MEALGPGWVDTDLIGRLAFAGLLRWGQRSPGLRALLRDQVGGVNAPRRHPVVLGHPGGRDEPHVLRRILAGVDDVRRGLLGVRGALLCQVLLRRQRQRLPARLPRLRNARARR